MTQQKCISVSKIFVLLAALALFLTGAPAYAQPEDPPPPDDPPPTILVTLSLSVPENPPPDDPSLAGSVSNNQPLSDAQREMISQSQALSATVNRQQVIYSRMIDRHPSVK